MNSNDLVDLSQIPNLFENDLDLGNKLVNLLRFPTPPDLAWVSVHYLRSLWLLQHQLVKSSPSHPPHHSLLEIVLLQNVSLKDLSFQGNRVHGNGLYHNISRHGIQWQPNLDFTWSLVRWSWCTRNLSLSFCFTITIFRRLNLSINFFFILVPTLLLRTDPFQIVLSLLLILRILLFWSFAFLEH